MTMVKHLKVLGIGNSEKLGSAVLIEALLKDLIKLVGMEPLGNPIIHDVPLDISKLGREPFEDEGGVTSQLIGCHTLSTSHIAIHTWPLRQEFHLDLYSCRFFSQESVLSFLSEVLQTIKLKVADLSSHCEWD